MGFQPVEYSLPHEKEEEIEIETSSAEELKAPNKKEEESEIEIEVVDDTPKKDRKRKASAPPEEVTDDELESYSEKVRNRIKHFSKGYHDERRAKETALREREELERVAQQLVDENKNLKGTVSKNQDVLLEQAKKQAALETMAAKRAYKNAYEAGDADKLLDAQEKLNAANLKSDKVKNFKPSTLQDDGNQVQLPQRTKQDDRAASWAEENSWFNQDKAMTGYALGVHEELVADGVSPTSDEYYETIDSRMQKVFPDKFEDTYEEEPKSRRKSNVVAPASRSTAPKKVTLTQTQVSIAKKLGVPLELYAKKVAEEMRKV
tara:strand:- start:1133 stop:2092 length:960 start_codon:yes stop_codon:yes gene_type:complete